MFFYNYCTLHAKPGPKEAVTTVADQSFDVAVVDLAMPGIDGIVTLKHDPSDFIDKTVDLLK
ncbi:MAG TPA: response regulator [Desulfocapsa sulfexigens]|nr:response regulator [Desulfocapsa sulfexigens]